MKAILQDGYGSPSILHPGEIPAPTAKPDEVIVRVRAAGLNAYDKYFLYGRPFLLRMMVGVRRPKRAVRGVDFAGTVESVGSSVTKFKPGDEVFGFSHGSLAELAAAGAKYIESRPTRLSPSESAALPMAGVTALRGLRDDGRLKTGQRALVFGAGGGVGTFAIQIAKAMGAHVTAVTNANNAELARGLGADVVLDYAGSEIRSQLETYDVILDISGSWPFHALGKRLRPNGTLVAVGGGNAGTTAHAPLGRMLKLSLIRRFVGYRLVFCRAEPGPSDLATLRDWVDAGQLRPVIDRQYTWEQYADAFRQLGSGQTRGKVVVNVG
jgi:NADPH:quinone reductase-like Zn-dependent oxidoreductase